MIGLLDHNRMIEGETAIIVHRDVIGWTDLANANVRRDKIKDAEMIVAALNACFGLREMIDSRQHTMDEIFKRLNILTQDFSEEYA